MQKIPTIYYRDSATHKVTDQIVNGLVAVGGGASSRLQGALATEKLDGTNVRLTVRNHTVVRVEKRRNPSKAQKVQRIIEPWYVDADLFDKADQYIFEAANNTDLADVPDGEWSGEAVGPKIQGNSLELENHTVWLFSLGTVLDELTYEDKPPFDTYDPNFDEIREWLLSKKSLVNPKVGIEGVVFWNNFRPVGKIKVKDF